MWSRQICSNCMILSCQYGQNSLKNVSNTLLNLCHKELRPSWRQKAVQPGTSNVYLIKWPVSLSKVNYWILQRMFIKVCQRVPDGLLLPVRIRSAGLFLNSKNAENRLVLSWRPVLQAFLGRINSEGLEDTERILMRIEMFCVLA